MGSIRATLNDPNVCTNFTTRRRSDTIAVAGDAGYTFKGTHQHLPLTAAVTQTMTTSPSGASPCLFPITPSKTKATASEADAKTVRGSEGWRVDVIPGQTARWRRRCACGGNRTVGPFDTGGMLGSLLQHMQLRWCEKNILRSGFPHL